MAKFKLTKKAVQDLKQIWNYTYDNWSEKQADKYYQQLIDNCSELSSNPTAGRSYDNILVGLRGAKVNKHIIFYMKGTDGEVEVQRILHQRMDLKSRFV